MKGLRLKTLGALLCGAALTMIALPAWAEPIVIKFSHVVAADTPKGKGAEFFKKRAEELTAGKVKVEVYPASSLYKDKEEVEILQMGETPLILAPSLAKFGPLGVKEFEVFDLPYIFDGYDDLHKVTKGEIGKSLLKKLEAMGYVGLAYWDNGFKVMSSNKPIAKLKDFKGQKMRIQPSKALEEQMKALGCLPQKMAFSEVYQALQTGVVDGTENPPSNLYTMKMHEVQKYLLNSDHGYLGYAVITNKKFWEGLPADVRTQLEQAMAEATDYANKIAREENEQSLAEVKKSGKTEIITPSPELKAELKKKLIPVHKEMESRIGAELIQSIYKETGFKP